MFFKADFKSIFLKAFKVESQKCHVDLFIVASKILQKIFEQK